MIDALEPCPYDKRGRHDLMAFFNGDDQSIPATLVCCHCGMGKQVPLTWTGEGTLDARTADEIQRAVNER